MRKQFIQIKNEKWKKIQRWDKWCDIERVAPKLRIAKKIRIPMAEFRDQQITNQNEHELHAKKLLDQLGIEYEYQKVYGPYLLDFYLPGFRVDLEIDGFYHRQRKQKKKDKNRAGYLSSRNVRTIRFWTEALKNEQGFKSALLAKLQLKPKPAVLYSEPDTFGAFMDEEYRKVVSA